MPTAAATVAVLLLLSFTLRPLSSTSAPHPRRILHQPLLPQDSPPAPPPAPSPPNYPFTTSAPDNSPFFQSYPSPPPPPSPASFATFPANISSLTVPGPGPSRPRSTSSKLIIAAVAAVIAAIAVVSLSVFLHLRHRTASRRSSSFSQSKSQSDNSSTVSFNQAPPPPPHRIPKLHRPSQSSSEFLYLGTLVNSHAPAAAAAGGGGGGAATTTRKLDSPELRPLPPLITQRRDFNNNAEVVSSRDDESEEFYSPKGSINGRESSIGTGSASRRAFAAVEVENFNGSTSNSSTTYSSTSIPGSGSPAHSASFSLSPANNRSPINSMPKSPDLIEIQAPLPPQMPSPSSPDRNSRKSGEISPRDSSVSDRNLESPALIISSPVHHSATANIEPPETRGLEIQACASPVPETLSSPELSPRNSDASDRDVESPARSSSALELKPRSGNDVTTSSELRDSELLESPTPLPLSSSPGNLESSMSDNNALEQSIPSTPEIRGLDLPDSAPPLPPDSTSLERDLRSVESPPRNSNVSDQLAESPTSGDCAVIAPPPEIQGLVLPESSFPVLPNADVWDWNLESPAEPEAQPESTSPLSPVRLGRSEESPVEPETQPESTSPLSPARLRSEESSPRNSDFSDHNVESPAGINSTEHQNSTEIPTEVLPEPASPLSTSSEESNVSDHNVESPARIISEIPASPDLESLTLPDFPALVPYSPENDETSPRNSNASDQISESPVSSPVQNFTVVWYYPTPPEMQDLSLSSPERHSISSQESSPRISNASDNNIPSPARISSPDPHELPSPSSPERLNESEESSSKNLEPPSIAIPAPPPPPPPRTPTPPTKTPVQLPALVNPLKPISFNSPPLISPMQLPSENSETNEESVSPPKPKLKPLHWDKVRASSDREMVWDQLKCSSFKLNEEMIETLFLVNTPKPNPNEATRWQVLPPPSLDDGDKILDPKKAQNIAILLKALHVTVDEVCEGLSEGNADILGTELLESLLKMAPTKEEERRLKECSDESTIKLGAAERFLKAVVDIPHAFKRVEALLYVSNFESEVDYLKKSFTTLEAACEELRTSRMFLKLLEAVLKTGNRMNVGTNRGDAQAFKLDTLLKLVDVKGADGKTTLLHFVVQEIIRSEGARLSGDTPVDDSDAKFRRLGLQVVSALSSELSNVKKAAVMDAEALASDVSKLARGIVNVKETLELNGVGGKYAEAMMEFTRRAEEENCRIQAEERLAMSLVKEITEYFHGNSAMEEPHPFRIFMVVRDFLAVLDRVCKDVRMINERTVVSSAHRFPVPVNPMLLQRRQQGGEDEEEGAHG